MLLVHRILNSNLCSVNSNMRALFQDEILEMIFLSFKSDSTSNNTSSALYIELSYLKL